MKQHIKTDSILPTDETILVVKRSKLFIDEPSVWHGLNKSVFNDFFDRVHADHEFQPRRIMEEDPSYKQIIPYLIFTHNERYFLMQRKSSASEQRLKNKYTLGIGGHIRQEDLAKADIMAWAEREFHEEVSYEGQYHVKPLGILNDDTNLVGQVHLGFVLLITGTSDKITIKSELKQGTLLTLDECQSFYDHMEGWSQMVFDALSDVKTTE